MYLRGPLLLPPQRHPLAKWLNKNKILLKPREFKEKAFFLSLSPKCTYQRNRTPRGENVVPFRLYLLWIFPEPLSLSVGCVENVTDSSSVSPSSSRWVYARRTMLNVAACCCCTHLGARGLRAVVWMTASG